MPNIADLVDIAEFAQGMGKNPLYVEPHRCLQVKHRRTRCHACVDVCPAGAVHVGDNKIKVDFESCVGCGACSTVCPSEALIPIEPPDVKLHEDGEQLLEEAVQLGLPEGTVCIACARKASRHEASDQSYIEVSCLCRVHEELLIGLVAEGAKRIVLVDGDCATCKLHSCDEVTQMVQANAKAMLEYQGNAAVIERASSFPKGIAEYVQYDLRDSRREFFSSSADQGKDAFGKTMRFLIKREASKDSTVATVAEALGLTREEDVQKVMEARRQTDLVDALYEVGEPTSDALDCRFFGTIEIDSVKCSMCCICAVVCPTKALKRAQGTKTDELGKRVLLEYWPSDCVQCHLCEDVCFKSCLTVKSGVSSEALFSFEPQNVG